MSPQGFVGNWPNRLWNMDKVYRYIGGQGAGGMGYGAPASVGTALANRKYGRISVNIQTERGHELRSGRAVDRRAPQDSVALDHAQQSRVLIRK